MATINLGSIKFNWRGAYAGGTAYAVDDVVSSGGSSYICILASTGNATSNGTYWEQMSSAGTNGTNGTDVGTTLTTQGDILYRDGSGLQRLPKGTAGQVLQMNSGATAPEYGTVSSDWVKIQETNVTSNVTNVELLNFVSADYTSYKIIISNLGKSGTTDGNLNMRYVVAGSPISDGTYYGVFDGAKHDNGNTTSFVNGGNWAHSMAQISNWNIPQNGDTWARHVEMSLTFNSGVRKQMQYFTTGMHNSGTYYITHNGGYGNANTSVTSDTFLDSNDGVRFFLANDQFSRGKFSVYGIK